MRAPDPQCRLAVPSEQCGSDHTRVCCARARAPLESLFSSLPSSNPSVDPFVMQTKKSAQDLEAARLLIGTHRSTLSITSICDNATTRSKHHTARELAPMWVSKNFQLPPRETRRAVLGKDARRCQPSEHASGLHRPPAPPCVLAKIDLAILLASTHGRSWRVPGG